MLKNTIKLAFRNLTRHKGFAILNLAGLVLGLTACLLIGLFVRDEKAFDKDIAGGDRIYRLYNERSTPGGPEKAATTPPMFATTLSSEFPEVDKTVRVMKIQSKDLFEADGRKIYEEGGVAADSTFFDVFPLPFAYGSAARIMDDPSSIILSTEMSKQFFGESNPVGKTILYEKQPFVVRGVLQPHGKFHLPINYIISVTGSGIPAKRLESWGWQQFSTYVKLKPGASGNSLERSYQEYIRKNVHPVTEKDGFTYLPYLQPLREVHLYSSAFKNDWLNIKGNITYVNTLTAVALFILLIAVFNFVNLATARSMRRSKEVGVRKTIGASRRQLMVQFIGETIMLAFISLVISIGLTFALLPLLNKFTEKQIIFDLFTNPVLALVLLALAILVGALAGFYPALVLSGFKPVNVLKGSGEVFTGTRTPWLRHSLVVVQFSVSVLLIICALVVIRQVNYLHSKDLGLNKDQILFFPMRGEAMNKSYEAFKNSLEASPHVVSASIGYGFPGDMVAGDDVIINDHGVNRNMGATQLMVDHDYIKTLGLQLVAGRDFSKDMPTDKDHAFIINETAVKQLGFGTPQQALGQTLKWKDWFKTNDSLKVGQVIGVVRDFHYKSLYDKVETAVLQIAPQAYWKVAVKLKAGEIGDGISDVKKAWAQYSPDYPIEYRFLDESFEQMYLAEDKLKSLLWIFTAITVFVACLGLFGLATYAAERRRKEFGIRKVLGAGVGNLVLLLAKNFILLVLISLLIAAPLALYFLHGWLDEFAYRIPIKWWYFLLGGGMAILIAMITISMQGIKAARVNPVLNLRSE